MGFAALGEVKDGNLCDRTSRQEPGRLSCMRRARVRPPPTADAAGKTRGRVCRPNAKGRPRRPRGGGAAYRALVERLSAVVYVRAGDAGGHTLYVSPQIEGLLGYATEEWLADAGLWTRLLHPEDRVRALAAADRARRTGDPLDIEYRLLSRGGRAVWVREVAAQEGSEGGRPEVWRGIMLDVTRRKLAEEESRRSREIFRRTFEAADVGRAHVSPDGRWLRVNDKLCEISGYTKQELLGTTFLELTPPEDRQASLERIHGLLEGTLKPYTIERRYVRKDGWRVWVDLSVSLIRKPSGEPDFFECRAEDVTEKKQAELVRDPLTNQELEVLRLIARWRTNREIAEELSYSESTIKCRVRNVLAKLGTKGRRQAVARAVDIGLIAPPR